MKLKAWVCKWWARLTGGHAVWLKHSFTGQVQLKIARLKWDPFDESGQEVWQIHHNLEYRILDLSTGTIVDNSVWQWRYVDEGLHVAQKLQQKS